MPKRRTQRRPWVAATFSLVTVIATAACKDTPPEEVAPTPSAAALPQRIVSGVVDSDELLWALGDEVRSRVVGVSPMVDDARYSTVAGVWPPEIPRVAATSEAMLVATPDLVIVAAFSAPQTRTLLEHAGVRTLVLDRFDGFADYRHRITQIATAVGARERGAELVTAFDASLPVLPNDDAAQPTVLSYVAGNVAGAGTSFNDVAAAAGLVNLPAREGIRGHKAVTTEQILVWDADFIVVDCAGDCARAKLEFAALPGFSSSRAVDNDHVLPIPSPRLYSAGAGMAEFATELHRSVRAGAEKKENPQ